MSKSICIDGVTLTVADDDPRLPPPAPAIVPVVAGVDVVNALSDAQASTVRLRDLLRIVNDPSVPVTNAKLVRMAKAVGMAPADLFAAAVAAQEA